MAVAHCQAEAGEAVAFIDAPEDANREIGERLAAGSPLHAHELDIPGLRFRRAGRFSCMIFYVETEEEIEVWHVPHGARDLSEGVWETRER